MVSIFHYFALGSKLLKNPMRGSFMKTAFLKLAQYPHVLKELLP